MRVRRIEFVLVFILAVLAVSFSFAGGRQEEAASAGEPVVLNLLMEDVPETHIIAQLLPEFEEASGIQVRFEIVQYGDMHAKLITQFLSRESKYDVIEVDNYWAGEFPAAGWLEPLTPYIERDGFDTSVYIPSMLDMVGYYPIHGADRELFMLPIYNYTMALVYRIDLLEDPALQAQYEAQYGTALRVPETLAEYTQVCKFMQDNAGVYGSAMQAGRGDPVVMEWSNYLFGLGGDFYSADWEPTINSPDALRAVELYGQNLAEGAPEGANAFNLDDSLRMMAQGDAFSMITYNWMLAQLDDPEKSRVAGNVAIAPMPGEKSLAGGWGWAIAHNTQKKDAAWEFIRWVESPEIAKERALLGGAPTRTDVLTDEEVLARYPWYDMVDDILDASKPVPEFEFSAQMVEVVGRELSLIFAEGKDPATAMNLAAEELAGLAADAGLR